MIDSVRGTLLAKEPTMAVVECGGVGYACRTTLHTLSGLGALGEEVRLYTHLAVREDSVDLFGFSTRQERHCFEMLISVSGVGPKAALAILSDVTPDRFALLVASGDSKSFTKTKGIGAKTAQRIVLELKDKIAKEHMGEIHAAEAFSASAAASLGGDNIEDAIAALMVLGYTQGEVVPLLAKLDPNLPSQELIKQTLRQIGAASNRR
ncbi:holliday junction ATP-dependent DNA helicase RuvA [Ruminococcus sp. CAG:403]|nr:Holliday junction branch migration protein RuvA [Ruminococcus sp.]CDE31495.1 holliday junction ATP-dependent DNA helicase RuvA [Ruminococcus sp. CAG:403]